MSIPDKSLVVQAFTEKFNCTFSNIKRKQIMYHGVNDGKEIVICTPSSKLHKIGKGWFDLNTIQVELLDKSDIPLIAIRLEGYKIYYVDFKELRKLMTADIMHYNPSAGDHWKFYVWEKYIQVQGNYQKLHVEPEQVLIK